MMNYAALLGSINKAPMLIPEHYDQWADHMEDHLSGIDEDLLRSLKEGPFNTNVQTRFTVKSREATTPPVETEVTIAANKKKVENDKRCMLELKSGVPPIAFNLIRGSKSAK
ncbi:hypothetical protein L2E82_21911 [Cichorium intybus]|uniref:Uncharacterized protein n=1 Tax=Cichorium intybus TaxID=13427 RepID=A0ACB9DWU4_CICIN|nr:hypothetical protein L2E82_21911 [Cichorium intybus]